MPRLCFDKPESPERISRHLRSTPIEIPKRRRPVSPRCKSDRQNESPDMIFEMSPVSPDFPAPARKSPGLDKDNEPFMYNAPQFRAYSSGNQNYLPSKKSGLGVVPSAHSSAAEVPSPLHPFSHTKSSPFCLEEGPPTSNSSFVSLTPTLTPSTTKITGFIPLIDQKHSLSDELSKPVQTLPPPPRRPSFSSSPWILPGRGGSHEVDVCYSQADPSAFEFRDHLLRRLETRDPSRLKCLHSCF